MYSYGTTSTQNLSECTNNIQLVFNEAIKHRDISIIEGHRSDARQHTLFIQGKSKLDSGESKHNSTPSRAVDAIWYPFIKADWNDREKWVEWTSWIKGLAAGLGIDLISGYDWDHDFDLDDQDFDDGPHFEEAW